MLELCLRCPGGTLPGSHLRLTDTASHRRVRPGKAPATQCRGGRCNCRRGNRNLQCRSPRPIWRCPSGVALPAGLPSHACTACRRPWPRCSRISHPPLGWATAGFWTLVGLRLCFLHSTSSRPRRVWALPGHSCCHDEPLGCASRPPRCKKRCIMGTWSACAAAERGHGVQRGSNSKAGPCIAQAKLWVGPQREGAQHAACL